MPKGGIEKRSKELSILSKISHDKSVDPKIGELLQLAKKDVEGDPIKARNLLLMQRDYNQEVRLPTDFVVELTRQESITESKWEEAKNKADFKLVQPELEKLFELVQQKAHYLEPNKKPYNVLLDLFEPGLTMNTVDSYFNPLKEGVIKLIDKCKTSSNQIDPNLLKVPVSIDSQRQMSKWIMEFLGMDPNYSRCDETEHPFTTGYMYDVRITTHYLENDPFGSIYSVFHEAGHALYDMNLPKDLAWLRVGTSASLGVHESQSRFCENIVGKNPVTLKYMYPTIQKLFPELKKVGITDIIRAVNAVVPSKIRIYADEVTYNLHVILRYEIERDFMSGKFSVGELPQVWNERMEKYLGQKITNDAEGALQDVHWYGGMLGYFPTYVLGNIYNGQMRTTLMKEIPDWETQLEQGKFVNIGNWIKTKVHSQAYLYDPIDLVERITGSKPNTNHFLQYLNDKYQKILSGNFLASEHI
jgi:carboxypeptidase Taq